MFWWSEGCGAEARGMRHALEQWAVERGCFAFGMACVENEGSGPDRALPAETAGPVERRYEDAVMPIRLDWRSTGASAIEAGASAVAGARRQARPEGR